MIALIIYVVGCFLAYRQCKRNFIEIDEEWTNKTMLQSIIMALFSWLTWFIAFVAYFSEVEDNKFKQWLEKDLKEKKEDKDESMDTH